MDHFTLLILAVGLAMDAFAVSICKGLSLPKISWKESAIVGIWFGGFQALMPVIGYLLGNQFEDKITSVDHWIAFLLLGWIGLNMVKESFQKEEEEADCSLQIGAMLVLAIATSIDALAVGITFAFLQVDLIFAITMIGVVTLGLSMIGIYVGHLFGARYQHKAELFGGIVLIALGVKILLEHLGVF